jgi:hypothetical protein
MTSITFHLNIIQKKHTCPKNIEENAGDSEIEDQEENNVANDVDPTK